MLELWYFTSVFLSRERTFLGFQLVYPVTLTIDFSLFLQTIDLVHTFSTVSVWVLIFHMIVSSEKEQSAGNNMFYPVTFTLEFVILFDNLNLSNNIWTVSARALMFHMHIRCHNIFLFLPNLLTLTLDLFLQQ